ncbi:DDE-type integrase/transposase/recombinase [Glutamicibacter creatinolyticus]|uniref:DDE-type integrase/transposase/recombinase n=1 Tax=Glutamicibacter creatinolyticus TaxID=162496 RepID=UPI0037C0236A
MREQGVQVAARTYRAWKTRVPALRAVEDAKVIDTLRGLNKRDAKGRPRLEILYGRRKMTAWLRRNGFPEVSKHTVDRLMRDEGMNGLIRGRKTRTTIPGKDGRRAGDLLNRNFSASAPNRIWVTDFTYVPVYSGFVYVALVIDLYSRAIVGWETSTVKDTAFVKQCLKMALWRRKYSNRPVDKGLLHHSDAGSQGGFNWSSQHPDRKGNDGATSGMVEGADRPESDDLSRASRHSAEYRAGVLESSRDGSDLGRCRVGCGSVARSRRPLVPARWRYAHDHSLRARRQVPHLRRARGDRASARPAERGARDRTRVGA